MFNTFYVSIFEFDIIPYQNKFYHYFKLVTIDFWIKINPNIITNLIYLY